MANIFTSFGYFHLTFFMQIHFGRSFAPVSVFGETKMGTRRVSNLVLDQRSRRDKPFSPLVFVFGNLQNYTFPLCSREKLGLRLAQKHTTHVTKTGECALFTSKL